LLTISKVGFHEYTSMGYQKGKANAWADFKAKLAASNDQGFLLFGTCLYKELPVF